MNNGIVYLIQPTELVGINRYKVGMSNSNTLVRCINGYNKGSRYLCIMECVNPLDVERKIIYEFSQRFKVVSGKEYFEGVESELLQLFCKIVLDFKTNENINDVDVDDVDVNDMDNDDVDDVNDDADLDDVDVDDVDDDVDDDENFVNGTFLCNICNNVFKTEYLYKKHKNKKIPCINEYNIYLTDEITEIKNKIISNDKCIDSIKKNCLYCRGEFSTKGNLKNHLFEYCKQRQITVKKLQKYKDELERITMIKNNSNHKDIQSMNKDEIIKLVYELVKNNSNNPININITK
jgi:hypothetical protein